jgi:hypothetical protein
MWAHYSSSLLLAISSLTQHSALAQPQRVLQTALNPSTRVDSVFIGNFRSIKQKLQKQQALTLNESKFIYVASFMSGIDFDIESYAGTPLLTLKKLARFESWYSKNKSRIVWGNLARGLEIVNLPPTDETEAELSSLRII